MTIDILIYPTVIFLAAMMAVQLVERQRDVLYGPYIAGRKSEFDVLRDQIDTVVETIGLRREASRMAVKFTSVGIFASAIVG
jgi:hypothetical protein